MNKLFLILIVLFLSANSCAGLKKSSRKNTHFELNKSTSNSYNKRNESYKIVKIAEKYLGVPYKYAGNTENGFDCSGLVYKVFEQNSISLPRRSIDQSKMGVPVRISETQPGDLLFFATSGDGKVSHVGIVHHIDENGEVAFIHSSTSKGVIISSLAQKYWKNAFLFARRIL